MSIEALFEQHIDLPADPADDTAFLAKALPPGGGAYALVADADQLVLLASGESLRRSIAFRLHPPPDASRKRAELRSVVRRIYWQPTASRFETALEFHRVARVLHPRDYVRQIAFAPAWFVRGDADAAIPRLSTTKYIEPGGVHIGPFATRTAADRFVETLQDLFDLCRYQHILEQAPHGQACAYSEMGKCPAPCDGRFPMDAYRAAVRAAIDFAAGSRESALSTWQNEMRSHARRQDFERAGLLKSRIDRARELGGPDARFARRVEEFSYLVLQRARGRTRVRPFFVKAGWIDAGEPVTVAKLKDAAPGWIARMSDACPPAGERDLTLHSESIWLVHHFLAQGDKAPGLFLGPSEWRDADRWLPQVPPTVLRRTSDTRQKAGETSPQQPDAQ